MVKASWLATPEKHHNNSTRPSINRQSIAPHSHRHHVTFRLLIVLLLLLPFAPSSVVAQSSTSSNNTTATPIFTVVRANDVFNTDERSGFTGVKDGKLCVAPKAPTPFTLYGTQLSTITEVFAHIYNGEGTHPDCSDVAAAKARGKTTVSAGGSGVDFVLELPGDDQVYQLCVAIVPKTTTGTQHAKYVHVPDFNHLLIKTRIIPKTYIMPMPLQIIILIVLLALSGTFSGLNLGLMSLDPTELKLIVKSGSDKEKKYAATILPIRKKGNYLLCTLLFGNVIVNAAIALLFDDLTTGLVALIVSSLGIVVFGEIIPQAICNRKGLAVGAQTIWLTRAFMIITFPLSFPVSLLLDKLLGEEAGTVYNRERLIELIRMSAKGEGGALGDDFRIISGALEYTSKTVADVMTKANNVFMLQCDTVLNSKKVAEIMQTGYTRIPVYENDRNLVVSLFNVKDLALLDPDDNFTVRTLCSYYEHPVRYVMEDTPLKVMLDEFRKGHYHMAMVTRIVTPEDGGDPIYQLTGVVTLEDIIEEIIQAEINDETDVITDNQTRVRRKAQIPGISRFMNGTQDVNMRATLSHQLQLAAIQYMTSQLDPFKGGFINNNVLQRLVVNSGRHWTIPTMLNPEDRMPPRMLFTKGKSEDKFVLMLEGRVQVTIGQSEQTYETGPFFHFGNEVLIKARQLLTTSDAAEQRSMNAASGQWKQLSMFTPDYTATAYEEITFIEITAQDFVRAYRTTCMDAKKLAINPKSRVELLRQTSELRRSLPQLTDCKEPLLGDRELGSTQHLDAIGLTELQSRPDTDRGYLDDLTQDSTGDISPRPASNNSADHPLRPLTPNGELPPTLRRNSSS